MVMLHGRLGARPRIVRRKHKEHDDTWAAELSGQQALTVSQFATEVLDYDKNRKRSVHAHTWSDDDFMYVPIQSIERTKFNGIVYNFEVADDHSYVAGGLTVHNCLEAQACGLPVVSTYIGGLSEMVIDGFNGIKVAPTLDELKSAVDYLIRNPDERTRMGKNARLVAEKFNIEKWQRRWTDVLKDLTR